MRDYHRFHLIKVIQLVRNDLRAFFGLEFANQCGHFTDRHMSRLIQRYSHWLDYVVDHGDLMPFDHTVLQIAISNGGRYLFTASVEGPTRVWDLRTMTFVGCLESSTTVPLIAYSQSLIIVAQPSDPIDKESDDYQIAIVDARQLKTIRYLIGHTSKLICFSSNLNCHQLASLSHGNDLRIWSMKSGECLRKLIDESESMTRSLVRCHFINSDHLITISSGMDKVMHLWRVSQDGSDADADSEEGEGSSLSILKNWRGWGLAVNCDHSLILCLDYHGYSVYSWPAKKKVYEKDRVVTAFAFHPFQPDVFVISSFGSAFSIAMHNVRTKQSKLLGKITGVTRSLVFTADGECVITVDTENKSRIWKVPAF